MNNILDKKKIIYNLKEEIKKSSIEIKTIDNINNLKLFKSKYLGKNSYVYKIIKNFSKLNNEYKICIGNLLNYTKKNINKLYLIYKKKILLLNNINNKFKNFDITIPCINNIGSLHPISITINKIEKKFLELGFEILNSYEIEDSYHNFDLLNIPINHPSRDKNNTFWINNNLLLRTQTSCIQSRLNKKNKLPIKILSYGKVYRRDKDKTHTPMFHQIDGIYIGKNINFSNLKYLLINFINFFFDNKKVNIRFRPSYFPFTEPSIEVDIMINNSWIEILGAGMICYKILKNINVNYNIYTGFAFGIGIERLIMIKYNIKDIKCLFENNLRFLNKFKNI